ncbi:MAG: bi-domain-containing oxidoreductase [Candidatus Hydrogenedens sp.]|nr:bi-domain-containing oxidoreductase [Candidatus Hydrogenedens sp.]
MLQGIIKKGKALTIDVPAPQVGKGMVLIKVIFSCISAGTELSGLARSKKPLIQRAWEQPDKVKKVLDILRDEGFTVAYAKVKNKLESGTPIGYSVSGIVIAVGEGINRFQPGDKVSAAGVGYAHHAEFVTVPENLVVKVPEEVSFEEASTVALGGIAIQSIRRANLQLGEFGVVFGAGILGLLTTQMLIASGIRTAVIDIDPHRLNIAKELGAELVINSNDENHVDKVINWSDGYGADAVIFTASTQQNEPLSQCFRMTRKKGKVVLVGVSGSEIKREDIYSKELDFLISTSYGPGRYDTQYEEKGVDYPYAYVRWTENRNMKEYLRLIHSKHIKLDRLIEKTYPIEQIADAFDCLSSQIPRPLIVLLQYGLPEEKPLLPDISQQIIHVNTSYTPKSVINVAIIGTGGFATNMHLPNLAKLKDKYSIYATMDRSAQQAKFVAEQYQAKYTTTNLDEILSDKQVDLVLITTRHDSHAEYCLKALQAGKHVFVEKPLAISQEELDKIKDFYLQGSGPKPVLLVGFNRRFSKYLTEIKKHTDKRINPLLIHYRMNAGLLPPDHWVFETGGRIIGEACHIIDTISFLTKSPIESISVESITPTTDRYSPVDNKIVILKYKDGSIACFEYFSVGSTEFGKEYMEVHFDGKTLVMDDYKSLKGYGQKINEIQTRTSQKGHFEELLALHDSITGKNPNWPIPLPELLQTTEATFIIK